MRIPWVLIKTENTGPPSQLLVQPIWGGARESAYFTSSQMLLMLLVPRPHFQNDGLLRSPTAVPSWLKGASSCLPLVVVTENAVSYE